MRKELRLKGYDYSQAGCYFVTVCIKDAHELLWEAPVGANCVRPPISSVGQLIESEIHRLSATYPCVSVNKYVIMPNHLHFILVISSTDNSAHGGRTQFAPTIGRIIKQFKGAITKQLGYSIWQRSFHDHIIRDDTEYQKICHYIDQNPAKWTEDRYYIK